MARTTVAGRNRWSVGVTLPELLVVVTIIGLSLVVAVPLVTGTVRSSRVRVAADQYAVTVKAARMIAVTEQDDVDLVVRTAPDNCFEYNDVNGRLRRYELPPGVRITSPAGTISFAANGSVSGLASTTFEIDIDTNTVEGWIIATNILGNSTVTHYRN